MSFKLSTLPQPFSREKVVWSLYTNSDQRVSINLTINYLYLSFKNKKLGGVVQQSKQPITKETNNCKVGGIR